MLKPVLDLFKGAAALVQRAQKNEENFKKLSETDHAHEENLKEINDILRQIIHQLDKDKALAERDKTMVEHDRQWLLMTMEAALKNDTRALPPGNAPQNGSDLEARVAALEKENEELKRRIASLENPV